MTNGKRVRSVAAALLVLLATGCGTDSGPVDPPTISPGTAGTAPGADAGITDYVSYTGATAGRADSAKPPIALGWINAQGGPVQSLEATAAAEATVRYVNAELGGIGGRPLELRTCFIAQSEEEGQRCGQQMLNDQAVVAIAYGQVYVGNQAIQAVIGGQKPIIAGVAIAPSDATAKNTYALFGNVTKVLGPYGTFARDVLKATKAALVYTNSPPNLAATTALRQGMQGAGVDVTSVGFEPQATDLVGPVTAAGALTADVVVAVPQPPTGCVGVAKALQQLGGTKPVVATPICLDPSVARGLGGDLPQWTYGVAQTLPTDAAPDATKYRSTVTDHGLSQEQAASVWSALAFSEILTVVKFMNAAGGDVTPAAVAAQAQQFTGPLLMGAPSLRCGRYADAPAVCNDQTRFYRYRGNGRFEPLTGWLRPPT